MHARVGSFPPNPFGFFDILGNVAEICEVDTNSDPLASPRMIRELCSFRGGSWAQLPDECRVGSNVKAQPRSTSSHIGIRVARSVMQSP